MSDPVVHITNGVPDSGTGNITTLGQTLTDGANATLGATTGAAVSTDTTGTIQQYLRGLVKLWAAAVAGASGAMFAKITNGTNTLTVDTHGSAQTTLVDAAGTAVTFNGNQTAAYLASTGFSPVGLPQDQAWKTGMSNKLFSVAFTTLTRPANVTAYSAGDSISDNAVAGSVTALTATVSDTNDDLLFLSEVKISSTDTGLAGKRIRAYLFNSDPTASTGVGAGDNAAYSQKVAGYIGSMSGILETGFSDGTVGRLVPSFNDSTASPSVSAPANGYIVAKPSTGGKSLWIQYQAIDAFTPSANSTTIIGTIRGWQGRAA